ncbi:hypothetical protein GCM10010174_02000 [Kutzneria viridogrisea]|uniref:Iron-regulated membrane protein n=1 Tax=Kutzneria viridogrisea TaxID=47990 RepID=A0ABR6BCX1_9PSEU|nr:putative iron-regulated membrane protein [Kutzneria viridogrisea]
MTYPGGQYGEQPLFGNEQTQYLPVEPPQPKRTGMIVMVIVVALVLVGGVGVGLLYVNETQRTAQLTAQLAEKDRSTADKDKAIATANKAAEDAKTQAQSALTQIQEAKAQAQDAQSKLQAALDAKTAAEAKVSALTGCAQAGKDLVAATDSHDDSRLGDLGNALLAACR